MSEIPDVIGDKSGPAALFVFASARPCVHGMEPSQYGVRTSKLRLFDTCSHQRSAPFDTFGKHVSVALVYSAIHQ